MIRRSQQLTSTVWSTPPPASGCTAWKCSTGAPSTNGCGRLDMDGPQRAAHRRHRLGQVDPGRRRDHAAAAGAPHRLQQGRRRADPRTRSALVRARALQVRAQRDDRQLAAGRAARRAHLLGDPRPLPQRTDFNADVTLAQVFWMKEGVGRSAGTVLRHRRRRVVDRRALQRLRLRADQRCASGCARPAPRCIDHFPEYSRDFRRKLAIASEQAMDLFHQTVSMKSVGRPQRVRPRAHARAVRRGGWVDKLVAISRTSPAHTTPWSRRAAS